MADLSPVTLDDLGIPPQFQRYADPSTPAPMKLMAAKGLVPAPPRALLGIFYALVQDLDPAVAEAAGDALRGYPLRMVQGAVDDQTSPHILDFLARERLEEEKVVELIVLRRQVFDDTLIFLAERVDEKLLNIIANNQLRLLACPRIANAIRRNPSATQGLIDRVVSFLQMNGVSLPPDVDDDVEIPDLVDEYDFPPELIVENNTDDAQDLPSLRKFAKEGAPADDADVNMWKMIQDMSISQRIALAMKGNATARSILIRSPSKMIALAVINSPRLTDPEVMAIAQNRNVIEEVLRKIAANKTWMRRYSIKVALISNPKTPVSLSMPLVPHLQNQDLKVLAKNRNVSSVISKRAKEMLKQRMK